MEKKYKHKDPPMWFAIPAMILIIMLVFSFCTSCVMEGWYTYPPHERPL